MHNIRSIMSYLEALNDVRLPELDKVHGRYTGVMACASAHAAEHNAAADENNGFLACVGVVAQKGSF